MPYRAFPSSLLYCVRRTQSPALFQIIFNFFYSFPPFLTFVCLFLPFFWEFARMPLLSRIDPGVGLCFAWAWKSIRANRFFCTYEISNNTYESNLMLLFWVSLPERWESISIHVGWNECSYNTIWTVRSNTFVLTQPSSILWCLMKLLENWEV